MRTDANWWELIHFTVKPTLRDPPRSIEAPPTQGGGCRESCTAWSFQARQSLWHFPRGEQHAHTHTHIYMLHIQIYWIFIFTFAAESVSLVPALPVLSAGKCRSTRISQACPIPLTYPGPRSPCSKSNPRRLCLYCQNMWKPMFTGSSEALWPVQVRFYPFRLDFDLAAGSNHMWWRSTPQKLPREPSTCLC